MSVIKHQRIGWHTRRPRTRLEPPGLAYGVCRNHNRRGKLEARLLSLFVYLLLEPSQHLQQCKGGASISVYFYAFSRVRKTIAKYLQGPDARGHSDRASQCALG